MKITRLLLGAMAPLAVATAATAADDAAKAPVATTESTATTEASAPRTVTMGPTVRDSQGNEGRIHTVVRGDTLWDISEAYLGDPLRWPTIWKKNPAVKDPHWIYPGNQIFVSATEMRPLAPGEAEGFTTSSSYEDAVAKPVGSFPVPHREQIGFVSAEELETAGALLGSPEGEKWLSAHRRAFVSFGEGQVQAGDRFTILRENARVRDPETGRTIGHHVDKLGWLEITKVGPESSEAMIRVSTGEILRGDRLVPRMEPALEVPVRSGATGSEGQIAFLPEQRTVMAQRDIVFLNRGSDQGVDVGSTLEVYRPGAVVKDRETKINHAMPDDVVANMIVVSARPETSVAIVTHATVELREGDYFRGAQDTRTSFRAPAAAPLDATQWTARTIEGSGASSPPAKAAPASK
jgi:hypothetical protein